MVQHHTHALRPTGRRESHGERAAVRHEARARQDDIRRTPGGVRALQVRRRVDLDAELGDVVFAGRLAIHGREHRHLHGIRARDHDGAVEEEQHDGMVQPCDRRRRARGPALAEGAGRVVDEGIVGRIGGDTEALRAAVAAVEEDDGPVGEEGALDHAAALGHRV